MCGCGSGCVALLGCAYCTARFFKSHSLKRRRRRGEDLTTYNRPVVGGTDESTEERNMDGSDFSLPARSGQGCCHNVLLRVFLIHQVSSTGMAINPAQLIQH
ncbi:uncharacterized [Tachysurus ichikawai]